MFTAKEIRKNARDGLNSNYGLILGGYLVVTLILSAVSGAGGFFSAWEKGRFSYFSSVFSIASFLVAGPMLVGFALFCLEISRYRKSEVGRIFSFGFGKCFVSAFLANFLKNLFTALWSLLFIVPGIIKALAYSMTEYIIADNPGIPAMEAINRSQNMMYGHKARLFRLYLSFIGWVLLSALTGGVLMLLYVGPYMSMAKAEFYRSIVESGANSSQSDSGESVNSDSSAPTDSCSGRNSGEKERTDSDESRNSDTVSDSRGEVVGNAFDDNDRNS